MTIVFCFTTLWVAKISDLRVRVRVRVRVILRLVVYRQSARLDDRPLGTHYKNFFKLNPWGHSPNVTSSLTRGWVRRLQLLLVLASAVILAFESCGTHDHILLFQTGDSSNLEGQVPVFISYRNRVAWFYLHFRRFLWLAGRQWTYSKPSPHGTDFERDAGISHIVLELGSATEVKMWLDEQKSGMLTNKEGPCG
jgi:hypothetical protein